jgi:hypothetical protein
MKIRIVLPALLIAGLCLAGTNAQAFELFGALRGGDGWVQKDATQKGQVQKGHVQKGCEQKASVQKGCEQKGCAQKGCAQKGCEQKAIGARRHVSEAQLVQRTAYPEGGGCQVRRSGPEGLRTKGLRSEGLRAKGLRPEGRSLCSEELGTPHELPESSSLRQGLRAEGRRAEGLRAEGLRPKGLRAEGPLPEAQRSERSHTEGLGHHCDAVSSLSRATATPGEQVKSKQPSPKNGEGCLFALTEFPGSTVLLRRAVGVSPPVPLRLAGEGCGKPVG